MSADSANAESHARRLVHLTVDERRLRDDARLLHLQPEVGALTGALADAGEHRHTTVVGRHPLDHLLDEHRLAHAGAAEEADLAALHVGLEEVDDLDAGLEHLRLRLELVEVRGVAVDLPPILDVGELRLLDVERLADHVEHVAQHAVAHRHGDAVTEVAHERAALEAVGGLEADGAHAAVADLLRDLGRDDDGLALEHGVHLDREVDLGQRVGRELDVDDRARDGDDATILQTGGGGGVSSDSHSSNLLRVGFRAGFEQIGLAGLDGVGEEVVGHELLLRPAAAPRHHRRSP